jgi:uroporphyrinogen-III synthase
MPAGSPFAGDRQMLAGLVIIVTRPRQQGAATALQLRQHGADVMQFPVLEISAISADQVRRTFDPLRVGLADAFIFVSANAVQFGLPLIRAWGGIPANARVFAIGLATARALVAEGVDDVLSPTGDNDSEGLLALPELLTVGGQHVVMVRGVSEGGGRTLLAETLIARGASLWPLECYQRQPVSALPGEILELSARLGSGQVHGFLVLSVETLDSLIANLQGIREGMNATFLVSHPRIAAAAVARGYSRVEVIPMGDDALPMALHRLMPKLIPRLGKGPE